MDRISKIYKVVREAVMTSEEPCGVDGDITNGFIFSNTYIPEEVIVNILTLLNWENILDCRLVCKSWKEMIDTFVGIEKVRKFHKSHLNSSFTESSSEIKLSPGRVPFYLYFAIGRKVFSNNHLKNPFGKADHQHVCRSNRRQNRRNREILICTKNCPKFKDWKIHESGGDGWITEDPPAGCDPVPSHVGSTSCFVTSYNQCMKEQIITLQQCGLNSKIMDEIQPHIEVSEWYAKRWDCGIVYEMHVSLLNAGRDVVDEFTHSVVERQGDTEWHQISHTFKDYGPGVRYIVFRHGGKDTQFWAGHYGSKMTGGSVIARIPIALFAQT